MTFIDITCMSDRSEEVIIETFPRRNDTPFFTTRTCRLYSETALFCRFTIIDPMHNLFLGTAKNILKNIWLDNFSANNLQHIQKLVDSSEVPKSIGSWKNST